MNQSDPLRSQALHAVLPRVGGVASLAAVADMQRNLGHAQDVRCPREGPVGIGGRQPEIAQSCGPTLLDKSSSRPSSGLIQCEYQWICD